MIPAAASDDFGCVIADIGSVEDELTDTGDGIWSGTE